MIKYVGVASSRDTANPSSLASSTVTSAVSIGWSSLLSEHESAWAAIWAAGITTADDPVLLAV